jgi:cytochrome d ubiquinol oxidase subunit I
VMVGMGVLMLVVSWWAAWKLLRRRREGAEAPEPRLLLWTLAAMTFSGWVATLAGWYVTEIGRQPFIVYGLLRTADVVAAHPPALVGSTLFAWLLLYLVLLLSYVAVLKYMAEHPATPAPEKPLPVTTRAGSAALEG